MYICIYTYVYIYIIYIHICIYIYIHMSMRLYEGVNGDSRLAACIWACDGLFAYVGDLRRKENTT